MTMIKNVAFVLAVIAATKVAKDFVPLPGAVKNLLP